MALLFQGIEDLGKGTAKTGEGVSGIFEGIFGLGALAFKAVKSVFKLVGGKDNKQIYMVTSKLPSSNIIITEKTIKSPKKQKLIKLRKSRKRSPKKRKIKR